MTRLQQAENTLRLAEVELRRLIKDAAEAGAYSELARLTEIAQQLSMLVGPADEAGSTVESGSPAEAAVPRKLVRKYPAFFRREEELIRVGWSKKTKREYRQAMQYKSVEAVVAALAKPANSKRPFAAASLEHTKNADGNEVPIYEIYNTIAWLRTEGLLRKRGRKGYVVPSVDRLEVAADKAWKRLQEYV